MPSVLRQILMLFSVLCSGVVGTIWRHTRWLTGMQPRILHGIAPLHSLRESVLADQTQGYAVHSAVLYARQVATHDLTTEKEFDVVFSRSRSESQGAQWACLRHILLSADIWHASFCPLWPNNYGRVNQCVMRLLRLSGIKIIAYPYGTDSAGRDSCRDRFDWIGALQRDYPGWDLSEHYRHVKANINLFCRYADLIIGMDGSVRRFLPRNDIYCKTIPVDTASLKPDPHFSGNQVPIICHAPNHRHVKGTQFLLDALGILREVGFQFELRVVERVARPEAIELYKTSDIIADQFIMGAYGVFALECLALGKPVMTYLDHDALCSPVFNLPILNTNRWNLPEVLAALLHVPELRNRIGSAGRDAIVRYQSLEAIGELHKILYDHVWWGLPLNLEKTRHFDPKRTSRSFTENPRDPEFWPVPVGDLMSRIRAAVDRLPRRDLLSDAPCVPGADRC